MDRRTFALPGSRAQYGPDRPLRVLHIDLNLNPDLERRTIEGICTTRLEAVDDGVDSIVLDAVDLDIRVVNGSGGEALRFESRAATLTVFFGRKLAAGDDLEFSVSYRVSQPQRGAYFIERAGQLWTQSQDSDARYWFPCVDYPDNKQTSSATIVVKNGLFALSNGALVERRDEAATTTFVYRQDVPHPTYLFTLVVGEFSEIAQDGGGVPVFYYVPPGREADGERSFGNTPKMIRVFGDFIGVEYPFARYGQIAVADFIFGGMENTAATTQTDRTLHDERAHLDFSSDPLVSHELAHQWFGDLLTTRDWSHAWLNEGFATYFEAVWYEAELGWDEYCYHVLHMVRDYIHEDEERYRRPIVYNRFRDPIELFDRHLYQKGGAVLHLLRGTLGHERFRRSIGVYVRENAEGSVETIDLIRAIETATGRNLRGFFEQWIERGGHPELEISFRYDAERRSAILEVAQKQKIDDASPPYRFDLTVGFLDEAPAALETDAGDGELPGERRHRLSIEREAETFAIPLEREPGFVRIDPGAYVLATVSYKLGSEMHARILAVEPDVTARIRAASALAKDGSNAARAALIDALRNEPFWGVGAELAGIVAGTRAPWAREALLASCAHPHPKVRRAVARALGAFRGSPEIASGLIGLLDDPSYLVVAAALESLGRTRDRRAFDILTRHLQIRSWGETIAAGAARGLAELADPRGVRPLVESVAADRPEELRQAALRAMPRLYTLLDERKPSLVEAIVDALDDPAFPVRSSAIVAAEELGERAPLATLRRIADGDGDGRLRRDAHEAIERIGEAQRAPAEVAALRKEIAELREELEHLRERVTAKPS